MIYSGTEFNLKFPNLILVKLTTQSESHNDYQFLTGLNTDPIKFNPKGECQPGGFYFCTLQQLPKWLNYSNKIMHYVRFVTIPDQAQVYDETDKFKANQLILSERQTIESLDIWKDEKYCLNAVQLNPLSLRYIVNQTQPMCMMAVNSNPEALRYVINQTEEMCLTAVKQKSHIIQYVHNQSELVCLTAVKQHALAIAYIKDQTIPICISAIMHKPFAFRFIRKQTPKICLEAVQRDGLLLQYCKYQTDEICLTAVKQNGLALQFVRIRNKTIGLTAIMNNVEALQYIYTTPSISVHYMPEFNYNDWTDEIEEICLHVLKENPEAIKFIEKPTKKMMDLITPKILPLSENDPKIFTFAHLINP